MLRAPKPLHPTLASIGAILLLIGMDVGQGGMARVLALIAASFALGIVAAERRHPILKCAALVWWLAGVGHAIDQHQDLVLALAALASWVVAWRSRPGPVSALHVMLAPLALAAALIVHDVDSPALALLALAASLAVVASLVARRMAWPALARSSLWLAPALVFAASSFERRTVVTGAAGRMILVTFAALLLHDRIVRLSPPLLWPKAVGPTMAFRLSISTLTMLVIGLQGAFILRGAAPYWHGGLALAVEVPMVIAFLVAAVTTRLMPDRSTFAMPAMAGMVVFWGAVSALQLPPGATVETIQWITVAVVFAWFGLSTETSWAIAVALVMTILRTIAAVDEVDADSTLELLVSRPMQPFVSALWALVGVVTVYLASRVSSRARWIAGANALALLVLKMLFVDLASLSVLAKVVVFVGVGVLFLLLGYLSPLPPSSNQPEPAPAA
jgi:uncharacterized membrane protein